MKNMPLNEKVYKDLKTKIINSEFKPGESLTIKNLTKIFKTSRTPIKEAINRLEKEGLIKNVNYKGAFINILSIKEIKEIFQIRTALEPFAVRLAMNQLREDRLNEFEKRFAAMKKEGADGGGAKRLNELTMEFHRAIHQAAQNDLLYEMLDNLYSRIEATKNFIFESPLKSKEWTSEVVSGHLKLIDTLKRKDGKEAEEGMKDHISKALNRMLDIL